MPTAKDIYTEIWYAKEASVPERFVAFLRSLLPSTKGSKSSSGVHKVAIIIGHNRVAKGAYVEGRINQFEYEYNSELATIMKNLANGDDSIEIKVFHRKYLGKRQYTAEIKEVYKRVTLGIQKSLWNFISTP